MLLKQCYRWQWSPKDGSSC